jgi:DNA-binding response OmpR family regulator
VVDVHVARLRQKLGKAESRVQIQTVRGSGFILTDA